MASGGSTPESGGQDHRVFSGDMGDFPKMNEVLGRFFASNPPACSTVRRRRSGFATRDVSASKSMPSQSWAKIGSMLMR